MGYVGMSWSAIKRYMSPLLGDVNLLGDVKPHFIEKIMSCGVGLGN